jgi:hypothetical protein
LVNYRFQSLFGGFAWGITLVEGGRGLQTLLPESRLIKKTRFPSRNRSPSELWSSRLVQIRQTNCAIHVESTAFRLDPISEPFWGVLIRQQIGNIYVILGVPESKETLPCVCVPSHVACTSRRIEDTNSRPLATSAHFLHKNRDFYAKNVRKSLTAAS